MSLGGCILTGMELRSSLPTENKLNTTASLDAQALASGGSESAVVGFDFVDFADCGAGDLVKLAVRANAFRQTVESYLSAVLVQLGELEGEDAVLSVCK